MIPSKEVNPKGFHTRYKVTKIEGETDPSAEYFVLRLDSNGRDLQHINACRVAVLAYAHEIAHVYPEFAADLNARYNQTVPFGDIICSEP